MSLILENPIFDQNGIMDQETIEGIVLRSIDFKDRQKILTLFTPIGLISLIAKGLSSKKSHLLSLTTPFVKAHFHYKKSQSDLHLLKDGDLLSDHLDLRTSFTHLKTAGALCHAILSTQFPGKPSLDLYELFSTYLKALSSFSNPSIALCSFYLKMLGCEGLLTLQKECHSCKAPTLGLQNGESVCLLHCTYGVHFSRTEWEAVFALKEAKSFRRLKEIEVSLELAQKIQNYFQGSIKE